MAEIEIEVATDTRVEALNKALEHLSSMGKQEIFRVRSLKANVEILRKSLPVMKEFMLSANAVVLNKELSSEHFSPLTKGFVKALKQFIYDGEDIVDEFDIQVQCRGHMIFIRKRKIACKMKKMYNRFQVLKEKNFLEDVKDELGVHGDEVGSSWKLSRNPSINMIQREDFKMVGRDKDKQRLVRDLLGNRSKPSVVLLTGMGGIGKTTFAHAILHDPQIDTHFAFKKWVTVGDKNFDSKTVLNQLIDEAADTLSKASENVRSTIEEKKRYLIVLDDVWEAGNLKNHWKDLWDPLSYGGHGSRVIITSREEQVQSSIKGPQVELRRLDFLSDEDCLEIFETFAFPNGFDTPSSSSSVSSRTIGKLIVYEKIKGIPLAARVIGSSLRGKPYSHWKAALAYIKDMDIINSSISWSYLNLSMHLKQCFVYCSLLPKNTWIDKTKIVLLWMAHNFVAKSSTQHNGGMTLVDIGENYFHYLVNASLIEVHVEKEKLRYKMHDVIHEFALEILGDEFSKDGCKDSMIADPQTLRHLVITKEDQKLPKYHSDIKKLHTIILSDPIQVNSLRRDQLKTVRSLSFTRYDCMSKTIITTLLKKLSQVRYLDISGVKISTLPESVCSMCALQTLILNDGTIHFPKNMSKHLVELHHIEAGNNVSHISGLRQLKKLHSIGGRFILHDDNGHSIEELRNLNQLRGTLCIEGLLYVQWSQLVSKERILENHEHLEKIIFHMDGVTTSEVLNYLQPHGNLKALEIKNYKMDRLATWLGNRDLKIDSLILSDCSVMKLPPLGCLPELENLIMKNFNKIEQIDGEFYGRGTYVVFPSLKKLVLEKMDMLQEWKDLPAISSDESFPSLKYLRIYSCNRLQALPKELPSSLEHLEISHCNSLQTLPKELPSSLEDLFIDDCKKFQALAKELSYSLKHLRITLCSSLRALPKELPTSLKELMIKSCKSLQVLPEKLPTSLKELIIESCDGLQILPKELPSSLEKFHIAFCDNLQALPAELPSSLKQHSIHHCKSLQALPKELPPSLENLKIGYCNSLQALPKEFPSSLEYFRIQFCDSLQALPEEFPSSLEVLQIAYCNKLLFLPKEFPSTLRHLVIYSCRNLETLPNKLPSSSNARISIMNCPHLHQIVKN